MLIHKAPSPLAPRPSLVCLGVLAVWLGMSSNALAQAAPPSGPSPATVEKAARALEANQASDAITLLTPPPVAGKATCILGRALRAEDRKARALLYLERCHRFESETSTRQSIASLRKALAKDGLAPVGLSLSPATTTATLAGIYEQDTLLSDDEIWLAKGSYRLEVQASGYQGGLFAVEVESTDRMLVPISLRKEKPERDTEIDLGAEAGAELGQVETATDPRPKKFDTLLARRYRRAPDPTPVTDAPRSRGLGPWPLVSSLGGLAALGGGIALQVKGQTTAAIVGYGAGAALGGLTAYLLLRHDDESSSAGSLSITDDSLVFNFAGRW